MKGIANKLYKEDTINSIQDKINMLSTKERNKMTAVNFLNFRLFTTIFLALFLIVFTNIDYFFIPIIVIVYYYLIYHILITNRINKRVQKIDLEALEFFEILTLCLESGKNLENSLSITCYNVDSELSDEFNECLVEVKYGKSLNEALNDLKKRIPSETVNNIILNMTQTSVFGNSIIETMNNQLDYLRDKQILQIKAQINKIPNKVSVISVLFIVPLILLIILGPFIMELIG